MLVHEETRPFPYIWSLCSADFEYVKRSMPRDLACADALIIRPILSPWKHWTPFSPQWQTCITDAFGNIKAALNCQRINIFFSWFINKTLLTFQSLLVTWCNIRFNIQQLYTLPTLCLCVLYLSENKQRLVPLTP